MIELLVSCAYDRVSREHAHQIGEESLKRLIASRRRIYLSSLSRRIYTVFKLVGNFFIFFNLNASKSGPNRKMGLQQKNEHKKASLGFSNAAWLPI